MGGALMSLNFYKIASIGAAAELQDIGRQRGEAAMGVLSSRIVRDLLVYVFPSVPLLFSRLFPFFC
jgi:hypothetical protein